VSVEDGEGLLQRLDTAGEIAVAAAVVLGGAYVLSFLAGIVVFAGFEAERDGAVLRIRRGFLARRGLSIPLDRVDGVVIIEGLLRGPLGLASLQIESASYGGEKTAARTLMPLVRRSRAEALIARLLPALTVAPGPLERPPRRALRRFALPPTLAGVVAGGVPALAVGGPAWAAVPALAAVGALVGLRAYRTAGVRLDGGVVVVREARLARRTLLVRSRRLQAHALVRTPLQARAQLADLRVTVGSGGVGRARHLDRATAQAAFGALRRGVAVGPER
jgi:putative membrane protein